MLLLVDENLPATTLAYLRANGHDVLSARESCRGWKDAAILERAETESRIVLTLDKDFWQIAMQRRIPLARAGVLLIRVHPATASRIEPLIRRFPDMKQDWAGRISVISTAELQIIQLRKP